MVKNKVNDMFEEQQNTGKSASLAKKYANAVAQLSDSNDRAARVEHDLQVERITRQGLIDDEVARRAAELEERIRLEVEAGLEERRKAMDAREQGLDSCEAEVVKAADTIAQDIEARVNKSIAELRDWAANTILDVPKDSLIFRALNYLLRNYNELTHYLSIPEMPIDNTDTERLIRDMVMGKKSYLFCRDLDACRRAAMMYSLFGACKVLGKNPERWLSYVLKNIKTMPKDKLYALLPEFWEDEG